MKKNSDPVQGRVWTTSTLWRSLEILIPVFANSKRARRMVNPNLENSKPLDFVLRYNLINYPWTIIHVGFRGRSVSECLTGKFGNEYAEMSVPR
jgi:hypothetical protein